MFRLSFGLFLPNLPAIALFSIQSFDFAKKTSVKRLPQSSHFRPREDGFDFTSVDKATMSVYRITAVFEGGVPRYGYRDYTVVMPGFAFSWDAVSLYSLAVDGLLRVFNLSTGVLTQIEGGYSFGTCIGCDPTFDDVVIGGRDSVLCVYRTDDLGNPRIFPTFHGQATSCAISGHFSLTACGTDDCRLIIFELKTGRLHRMIDLHLLTVKKILITRAWGFIVVLAEDNMKHQWILLYSVNGEIIRRKALNFRLKAWTTF
jgi:WD40 repeat protein